MGKYALKYTRVAFQCNRRAAAGRSPVGGGDAESRLSVARAGELCDCRTHDCGTSTSMSRI